MWFEALRGICAHVRPVAVDPVGYRACRLSQQQIDELHQRHRVADILPLTPLQQGCSSTPAPPTAAAMTCMRFSLMWPSRPVGSAPAARGGGHGGQPASQPGGRFWTGSTSRCR
ncbi:linear gramicidin synthetase subunit C domain protein [Mycobacterium xenopi 4042]|uniref:Linear gramicidin synthetase subunit C domain protein n=1 Tax=Mycobacterium xenopi 4042 TaxID=1299334 RepID=X8E8Q5_MYCXE|nr:linear gramicidin synthetase subunit C domain protein [Mycobacterium xenopi 4042]